MDGVVPESQAERVSNVEVEETDALLTASEAASLLHIHTNTVRNWSNLGILPSFRIGPRSDRRFRKKDLVSFFSKYK